MLEFTCSNCGQRVQGYDAFAGKHACPACNAAMNMPAPTSAIATQEHAAQTKIAMPTASSDGAFRVGVPPTFPQDALPEIRKSLPSMLARVAPVLVVVVIVAILVGLLVPAVQKVREAAQRCQSMDTLCQLALSFHSFHDVNKRLPFNGTVPAVGGDNTSGSWAFQVLPYIEQGPMFANPDKTVGLQSFMCTGRGRPKVSKTGAWTDFFINTWINDPVMGAVNAPDGKYTMKDITDGTSNTIFLGHGSIDPNLYSSNVVIAQSTDIFRGGDPATARRLSTNQRDNVAGTELTWGSPFSQGACMGMGDGCVRLFPYATHNALMPFLTPANGDRGFVPD